jgi:hypothetical protein
MNEQQKEMIKRKYSDDCLRYLEQTERTILANKRKIEAIRLKADKLESETNSLSEEFENYFDDW